MCEYSIIHGSDMENVPPVTSKDSMS